MARYESEFTLFMQEYKKQNPNTLQKQRQGRARLWDKAQDAGLKREFDAARITGKRAGY